MNRIPNAFESPHSSKVDPKPHVLETILAGTVESCTYDPEVKRLTIRGAHTFPLQILEHGQDIKILDMSQSNKSREGMKELPADIGRLENLEVAFFSNNPLKEFPSLAACTNLKFLGMKSCEVEHFPDNALPGGLRWLTLTDNHLSELPKTLGQLASLEKLLLTGNELKELPQEMLGCRALRLIRLASNNLSFVPDFLFTLPELAWYGDAGNPYSPSGLPETLAHKDIPWSQLSVDFDTPIGKSAQNEVFAGHRLSDGERIAVKLFGRALNSDGTAEDDMNIGLIAGTHPNLIGAYGRTTSPDGRMAQVLPLIPPEYTQLALPPNFDSCSRDTFRPETVFSPEFIYNVANGTKAGYQHLHERGIMHGDLYGHNTLANPAGDAKIGDFGAATRYDLSQGDIRERIDIRAFGYFIDDLLSRVDASQAHDSRVSRLIELRSMCLQPNPYARPLFKDITL